MGQKPRPPFSVDQLNQMQRYLGEEMIEDYHEGELTRRQMLRRLLGICGGAAAAAALLVACGETVGSPTSVPAAPNPTTPPEPTSAPEPTAATEPTAAPQPTAAAATAAPAPSAGGAPLSVPADDPAVSAGPISYESDTTINAYIARPSAEGSYPGVIVIHENRGLTDHIRDVARRVAKAGYVALAPDLASRGGGTDQIGASQLPGFFANANPEELLRDLNAGIETLAMQRGVVGDKFGVVGFCFGGAYTLRLAANNPNVAAAVCYYGVTPEPASQMGQTNAAILGQYGGNDSRVNSTIPQLDEAMQSNGKVFESRVYDGASHAFNNDTSQNYNEAAAVEAWQATLDWFGTYLKG